MIAGRITAYYLDRQLLVEHAYMTGQWSSRPKFAELLGHEPISLDLRTREEAAAEPDPLVEERLARTRLLLAEAQARSLTPHKVDGGGR